MLRHFFVIVIVLACRAIDAQSRAAEFVFAEAAVAADHELASQAGLEMLERGGNAIDAAVATSFCLSVVRPYSCGIGGGGFMLIYIPGEGDGPARTIALNYRETAPAAVGPDYYVTPPVSEIEHASRFGLHAVGVPGTVAGLLHALEHYGTLGRATVLAPAIRIAEKGYAADAYHVKAARVISERLQDHPQLKDGAAAIWSQLCHEGDLEIGDRVTDPAQLRALRLIAEQGRDAFYDGPIAEEIARIMAEQGGPITRDDLREYEISIVEPIRARFRQNELLVMPPPSSGGIAIVQVLELLERWNLDARTTSLNSPAYIHLVTEAMKHAFADRAEWLADPAFIEVPADRLVSQDYLDTLAAKFDPDHTLDLYAYGSVTPAPDDGGTSHFCVIDSNGMAVSCTETINLRFGSLVGAGSFGFPLNNEMDDFTTIPGVPNAFGLRQSDRNLPERGKRPLSSMSPTIVLRDGDVHMMAGASGGPRIITGTMQVLLNGLVFDLPLRRAIEGPRFHHQWMPNVLEFEQRWTDAKAAELLRAFGHEIGEREDVGHVQAIRVMPDGIHAASDPRKGGHPAGY